MIHSFFNDSPSCKRTFFWDTLYLFLSDSPSQFWRESDNLTPNTEQKDTPTTYIEQFEALTKGLTEKDDYS